MEFGTNVGFVLLTWSLVVFRNKSNTRRLRGNTPRTAPVCCPTTRRVSLLHLFQKTYCLPPAPVCSPTPPCSRCSSHRRLAPLYSRRHEPGNGARAVTESILLIRRLISVCQLCPLKLLPRKKGALSLNPAAAPTMNLLLCHY